MGHAIALGIDVETTGLNKTSDEIIEIAACVIDSDRKIVDYVNTVVIPGDGRTIDDLRDKSNPTAQQMHDANGLWRELRLAFGSAELTTANVANRIVAMARDYGITPEHRVPILGSSPLSLDKPMLDRWMPEVSSLLTHHSLDATTLVENLECFHGYTREQTDAIKKQAADLVRTGDMAPGSLAVPHRAFFDVMVSLRSIGIMEQHLAKNPCM